MAEQHALKIRRIKVKGQRLILSIEKERDPGMLHLFFDMPTRHDAQRLEYEMRKTAGITGEVELREDDD